MDKENLAASQRVEAPPSAKWGTCDVHPGVHVEILPVRGELNWCVEFRAKERVEAPRRCPKCHSISRSVLMYECRGGPPSDSMKFADPWHGESVAPAKLTFKECNFCQSNTQPPAIKCDGRCEVAVQLVAGESVAPAKEHGLKRRMRDCGICGYPIYKGDPHQHGSESKRPSGESVEATVPSNGPLDRLKDFVDQVHEWVAKFPLKGDASEEDKEAATVIYCCCEGAGDNIDQLRSEAASQPAPAPLGMKELEWQKVNLRGLFTSGAISPEEFVDRVFQLRCEAQPAPASHVCYGDVRKCIAGDHSECLDFDRVVATPPERTEVAQPASSPTPQRWMLIHDGAGYNQPAGMGDSIDDFFVNNVEGVHLERMADNNYWMGIDLKDGRHLRFWIGHKTPTARVNAYLEIEDADEVRVGEASVPAPTAEEIVMCCRNCGHTEFKVVDDDGLGWHKECAKCGCRKAPLEIKAVPAPTADTHDWKEIALALVTLLRAKCSDDEWEKLNATIDIPGYS